MTIKTPEDLKSAIGIAQNLRDEVAKLEKQIDKAGKKLEQISLEKDIFERVTTVYRSKTSADRYDEINVFHGKYQFVLTKEMICGSERTYISLQTWKMIDDGKKFGKLICVDQISTDYGINLVCHFITSMIFKRMALIRKELRKIESQSPNAEPAEKSDGHGNSETAG